MPNEAWIDAFQYGVTRAEKAAVVRRSGGAEGAAAGGALLGQPWPREVSARRSAGKNHAHAGPAASLSWARAGTPTQSGGEGGRRKAAPEINPRIPLSCGRTLRPFSACPSPAAFPRSANAADPSLSANSATASPSQLPVAVAAGPALLARPSLAHPHSSLACTAPCLPGHRQGTILVRAPFSPSIHQALKLHVRDPGLLR